MSIGHARDRAPRTNSVPLGRSATCAWTAALCTLGLAGSACGPSAQRLAAEDSVRTSSRAIAEVHGSGGESPPVEAALSHAEEWLAHSEEAVSEWGTGPRSLAWETLAPCLARSLRELRDALRAERREIPAVLDAAEAAAAGVTSHTCPRPEAPR